MPSQPISPSSSSQPSPGKSAEALHARICAAFTKERPELANVQLEKLLRVSVVDALSGEKVNGDAKARRVQLAED